MPAPVPAGGAKPAGRPASAARAQAAAAAPAPASSKKPIFIGLGVFVGFAVIVGALIVFLKQPADSSSPGPEVAQGETSGEPETDMGREGISESMAPTDKMPAPVAVAGVTQIAGFEVARLPQGTELIIGLKVAELLATPVGKVLMEKVGGGESFQAAIQNQAIQLENIDTVVLGVNMGKMAEASSPMGNGFPEMGGMPGMGDSPGMSTSMAPMGGLPMGMSSAPVVAVVRLKEPVEPQAPEGAEKVEFEGKTYYRLSGGGSGAGLALHFADSQTAIMGEEDEVLEALGGKPMTLDPRAEGISADKAKHGVIAMFPSPETLEKGRQQREQQKAAAGNMAMGNPFAPLTTVLEESVNATVISLDATDGLDVALTMFCKDDTGAAKLGAMFQAMLPQVSLMASGFTQGMPPLLKGVVDQTLGSLNSSQEARNVDLNLALPAELFQPETGKAIESYIESQMMAAFAGMGEPTAAPPGKKPRTGRIGSAPKPDVAMNQPTMSEPLPDVPPVEVSPPPMGQPQAPAPASSPGEPQPMLAGGEVKIIDGKTVVIPPPPPPARNRALRAWTMDFSDAYIPEDPASGNFRGEEFEHDEAVIENNVIILRQSKYGTVRKELRVSNFLISGEKLGGKTYESEHVTTVAGSPVVSMRWKDPTKTNMQEQGYFNNYAIKFELGEMLDGRIKGKIFIAVPDGQKSYVSGTFDAEVR